VQYTILGRTGLKVSRLGFGCMRLPMKDRSGVDRELAVPMLRRACELGINLFDTAVGYCAGDSQRVLGETFEGMRDKVILSTKNPHYDKSNKPGWWKHLTDSLERLRTNYIDIYNHHGMNYDRFEEGIAGQDGLYQEMAKAKEQRLIRHIGFSFHGPPEHLVKLADTGLYDTVILQYNLLYRELEEAIAYAAQKGMGILVMGPVGGGRLGYPSQMAARLVGEVKSTPELALRFVLSNQNVHVALSGMSTMQQLEENARTAAGAGALTQQDHGRITAAIEERKKLAGLYCTGCNYCMPCPAGVDIPANFEILNLERVFGLSEHARELYAQLGGQAVLCRQCGKCLEPCPQNIDIPKRLAETVQAFDERAGNVISWAELHAGSIREGMLHLKLRYALKNLTHKTKRVRVVLLPHGEDQVRPQKFSVAELAPFALKRKDIDVAVTRSAQGYSLDAIVSHDGADVMEHFCDVVAVASRVEAHSLDASRRRPGAIHVPSALHPVRVSEQAWQGHSFDFCLTYDDENLYLYADVEDDLAGAAKGEHDDLRRANHLCINLDGRAPHAIGRGSGGAGVARVMLAPPAAAGGRLIVRARNMEQPEAVWKRSGHGYRVDCAIPWRAFVQVPAPPAVIGFDVGIRCFDAQGKQMLSLSWTGRPARRGDALAWGKVLTV